MAKDLTYYMSLHYPAEINREEANEGMIVAFHPDLPGCIAQGSTADEALANLDEARAAWIEVALEDKIPVPEPPDESYSGKILLRMSPALHAAIARRARRDKVSVNHFVVNHLAAAVGIASAVDYMARVREEMQQAMQAAAAQHRAAVRPPAPLSSKRLVEQPTQEQLLRPPFGQRSVH